MTVLQDLILLGSNMKSMFRFCSTLLSKISFWKRTKRLEIQSEPKASVAQRIKNIFCSRAKLTYWLADEEVVVYVSKFTQKDKFKLLYTEIETGRQVMVNSSEPINYRLEELKATDTIQSTEIQQNQRY